MIRNQGVLTARVAAIVVALAAIAPMGASGARAETTSVTFVLVNDIYEMSGRGERGGFARLAGVVRHERANRENVIYVHAGDTLSPSLFSGFDQGAHIIELTNIEPPDIFVPGNHEFDFGPDVFRARMAEAEFPVLAANLRDAGGAVIEGIEATALIDAGPARIGIVGLTADDSPVKSSPGNLRFSPTVATGVTVAEDLRASGADLVVAVVHASRAQDQELFGSRAFDIILSGDDHDLMLFYDGRTVMAESKQDAEFVTVIDVAVEITEGDRGREVEWWPNFRIIDTAGVTPDPEVASRVADFESELSAELDVTLRTVAAGLDSRRATVRGGEAAIGNLIADAMRSAVGADIAITNGGGIRGNRIYDPGTAISRRDILTELPFGNKTLLLEVSGAVLADALENGVSEIENGAGRFPQISGITFTLDPGAAPGQRVSEIMVGGAPLDRARAYTLATNDFMARGGDGYGMLRSAKVLLGALDGKLMANDVMAHIRNSGEIAPVVERRIKVK
jgi:2',3'-cyclic-nucleotide 2'-phosphodiesterase (5'-nucleotidase family)